MKLKEFNFNNLNCIGLCIFVDGKLKHEGSIGEVLKEIEYLAEKEIKKSNRYFDEFVIRV